MITIVALVCHLIVGAAEPNICIEAVVAHVDGMVTPMVMCEVSQPAIAQWKATSNFSSPDWYVARFMCKAGDYKPKDTI